MYFIQSNTGMNCCSHPLFPLLAMMFEKCESATSDIGKVTCTETFNMEMDAFARDMEKNRSTLPEVPPLKSGNEELDNLVCTMN